MTQPQPQSREQRAKQAILQAFSQAPSTRLNQLGNSATKLDLPAALRSTTRTDQLYKKERV